MQLQMALVAVCDESCGEGSSPQARIGGGQVSGEAGLPGGPSAGYGRKCPLAGKNRLTARRILDLEREP